MSVDIPELRNNVIKVLEHKSLDEDAAFELIDGYYKAQASKDIAEVIGKDYEADLSKLPHAEFAVRVGANYEKSEMRKRATSKGYKVEEENLNG